MSIVNLGKIGINVIDVPHVLSNTYKRLDVVQDSVTAVWYIAHSYDVPTNINITDQSYWKVFFDGVANDAQVAQNTTDIATLETQKMDVHTHPYALESTVSTASDANTIAKRDSNGYIFADYFNTSCGDTLTAPTDVFINYGNNGYIYKQPIATFKDHMRGATPSWLYATLVNGFTQWVRYRKWDDGLVEVQLYCINSSGSSSYANTLICTLPVGFRPSVIQRGAVSTTRSGYAVDGYVTTDGTIYSQTVGAYYHFAHFTYRV